MRPGPAPSRGARPGAGAAFGQAPRPRHQKVAQGAGSRPAELRGCRGPQTWALQKQEAETSLFMTGSRRVNISFSHKMGIALFIQPAGAL